MREDILRLKDSYTLVTITLIIFVAFFFFADIGTPDKSQGSQKSKNRDVSGHGRMEIMSTSSH